MHGTISPAVPNMELNTMVPLFIDTSPQMELTTMLILESAEVITVFRFMAILPPSSMRMTAGIAERKLVNAISFATPYIDFGNNMLLYLLHICCATRVSKIIPI